MERKSIYSIAEIVFWVVRKMNSSINSIGSQIVDNNEVKFHAGLLYWILNEMKRKSIPNSSIWDGHQTGACLGD